MNIQQILEQENISQEKIQYNVPMSKYTSFKVGGPAECLIKIETLEELKQILEIAQNNNIKTTIIGNGSNILVKDKGIKGIVLKIEIKKFELSKENELIVGSGNKLGEIAQKLAKEEITGFEFASGIPGTIGGAIRMNAGAHGGEMKDIVKSTQYMDENGNIKEMELLNHEFDYRKSIFSNKNYIILKTTFCLKKGDKKEIENKIIEYRNWRKEKQPLEYPNAGSTFKRGKDFITAKLIDECGLKGYKIGGAQVSEKHAGFIINTGNATAEDILRLIEYTKKQVYDKFGKEIEPEIEII